jgi:uncharacterized protein
MIERSALQLLRQVVTGYHKMAFLSGPRQVGKTTLSQAFQKDFSRGAYVNWDVLTDQKKILKDPYFFERLDRDPSQPTLVIFDEIHKYARWKNYLKGVYDRFKADFRFVVTGSGRLELFKKGGDSLLGRYLSVPLFPLSIGELAGKRPTLADFKLHLHDLPDKPLPGSYTGLFHWSGFPEPFVRAESPFYQLWFQERKSLLIREDIRNASAIRELSQLEMLSHLLPERVGAPLSINSLREDIGVAFETVRDWLLLLDQFFYSFRIQPFAGKIARSLKKESKVYLYDWVEVPTEGYRFENLVALHLLKAARTWTAAGEGEVGLHYLRDKEKRETDFVLTHRMRPICLIECKYTQTELDPSLVYFQKKLNIPVAVQLVHQSGIARKISDAGYVRWIVSADRWLQILP